MDNKILFLLLTLHSITLVVSAQKDDGLEFIKNAGITNGSIENITYYKEQKIPFRNILVIDKRFDSSKAGYTTIGLLQNNYVKIIARDSWTNVLNNYFKKNLDSTSHQTLVIIMKSFWLQKGVIDEMDNQKTFRTSVPGNMDIGGYATADMDIFVQTGTTLQALFRIDTSFLNMASSYNKNRIEDFLFLPFDSIARQLNTINVATVLKKRRKLNWKEVNTYYNQRFDIPVLKDTAIKKGIFLNFTDFKNNSPLSVDFRFKNGRITDELYIVNNGDEELVTSYWGVFDGKSLYIQTGMNAFKAIRQQNSFELFGAKHISNYYSGSNQNSRGIAGYTLERKILQVNMDTGELY